MNENIKSLFVIFPDVVSSEKVMEDMNSLAEQLAVLEYGIIDRMKYPENVFVIDSRRYESGACAKTKEIIPKTIWNYAFDTDILKIRLFPLNLKLWWFLPISEKNPLRVKFIDKYYKSRLLSEVLSSSSISKVYLYANDPKVCDLFSSVTNSLDIEIISQGLVSEEDDIKIGIVKCLMLTFKRTINFLLKWAVTRIKTNDLNKEVFKKNKSAALLTLFPAYFTNKSNGVTQDTLFDNLPEAFESNEVDYFFISQNMLSIKETMKMDFGCMRNKPIIFMDEYLSIKDIFLIIVGIIYTQLLFIYLSICKIKSSEASDKKLYGYISEEILQEIYAGGSLFNSFIYIYSMRSIIKNNPNLGKILYTFEYQPRERAIQSAVDIANDKIITIGVQANVMILNHLNWFFMPDEIESTKIEYKAAMPDILCLYSEEDYRIFSERVSRDNLKIIGPLRHNSIFTEKKSETLINKNINKSEIENGALMALSVSKGESIKLIEMTFKILINFPSVFLNIKFHPLNRMHKEVQLLAEKYNYKNYKIEDCGIEELINKSILVIQPSSSVAVIAIALGKMPIILFDDTSYTPFALRDYQDAAFFIKYPDELHFAIASCLNKNEEYLEKKKTWLNLLDRLFGDNDGKSHERLYNIAFQT